MDLSICIPCLNRSRMTYAENGGPVRTLEPLPWTVDSVVQAVMHLAASVEVVVADYGSTDWPLAEWLADRAEPMPATIVTCKRPFTLGGGKNRAAEGSCGDFLFFLEADMSVPGSVIRRGLQVAGCGQAYFPRYRREHEPGGKTYWGSGHGCCIVRRTDWEAVPWQEGLGWGFGEDTAFAHRFKAARRYVREDQPEFLHRWHPMWESKLSKGGAEQAARGGAG